MNNELIEEIDQIPMLPESILKVEKVYAGTESSISDMTEVLSGVLVVVANILIIANSPMYGFRIEIKDISRTVSLSAKDTIRSFTLNIAAFDFNGNLSKKGLSEAYDLIEEYELDRPKFDTAVAKIELTA